MADPLMHEGPLQPVSQPGTARGVRWWLVVILALGLLVRLVRLAAPLQLDELGSLYAVAERPAPDGMAPGADTPLRLVQSTDAVRERSVLPYGIANPWPVYHLLLYSVLHVFAITEASLRLPSLLAGLGCILGMHVLGRRLGGEATGLLAALYTALDPIQIGTSVF